MNKTIYYNSLEWFHVGEHKAYGWLHVSEYDLDLFNMGTSWINLLLLAFNKQLT